MYLSLLLATCFFGGSGASQSSLLFPIRGVCWREADWFLGVPNTLEASCAFVLVAAGASFAVDDLRLHASMQLRAPAVLGAEGEAPGFEKHAQHLEVAIIAREVQRVGAMLAERRETVLVAQERPHRFWLPQSNSIAERARALCSLFVVERDAHVSQSVKRRDVAEFARRPHEN